MKKPQKYCEHVQHVSEQGGLYLGIKLQSNQLLCLIPRILLENSCCDSTSDPSRCLKLHVEKVCPACMVVSSSLLVACLRLYLLALVTCVCQQ